MNENDEKTLLRKLSNIVQAALPAPMNKFKEGLGIGFQRSRHVYRTLTNLSNCERQLRTSVRRYGAPHYQTVVT